MLNKTNSLYQEDIARVLSIEGINSLQGKSFLITGSTGLLGVHLIDVLMRLNNVTIYAVGRSKEKAQPRLGEYYNRENFIFIEQDVCQPFPEDLNVDYIIPGASNTHPLAYSQYPIETMMVNIKGAEHALNLAERSHATVLYLSTVEIYGNAYNQENFSEDSTGKLALSTARSCYTESKRACEALCQSYIAEKGVEIKIVRLSRIFGPTMLDSDSKASSQFIKKAIANEDIVLKSKGTQFFSYTYVTDAVSAMLYILLHGEKGIAYNISNELCDVQLREFAQICANYNKKNVVFDIPSELEQKGFSVASRATLDNSKLKKTGFQPSYAIKDAITRTIEIMSN